MAAIDPKAPGQQAWTGRHPLRLPGNAAARSNTPLAQSGRSVTTFKQW